MTDSQFKAIEAHMLHHMQDSAHDKHHIYRVLRLVQDIAVHEPTANHSILIAAALLHDIGRKRQFADSTVCHAQAGGEMAYDFLVMQGWSKGDAAHVRNCIISHRFRKANPPATIEAKILFDADKLDVAGAMGIARTLLYKGDANDPLYALGDDGGIITQGRGGEGNSFIEEYNYKLKNIYDKFYTARGKEIGDKRQKIAVDFYAALLEEIGL